MITLFLDIDNTLIYSHRHDIPSPKRVAEVLNGKEQSYITQQTFSFFAGEHGLQTVPVSTRTMQQFRRLEKLIAELNCEYSLICNGAILLHNMESDNRWYEETLALAESELPEIAKAKQWLISRCGEISTHSADGLLVYAKSPDSKGLASDLCLFVDNSKVDVLFDHSKIYCIPKTLNKGSAINRFSQRFNVTTSIAAGDSDFDIPMLNQAGIAIAPKALDDKITNSNKYVVKGRKCFSDELCSVLGRLLST